MFLLALTIVAVVPHSHILVVLQVTPYQALEWIVNIRTHKICRVITRNVLIFMCQGPCPQRASEMKPLCPLQKITGSELR